MRLRYNLICLVTAIVYISGCSNSHLIDNSTADWAFEFVVWDGYIYKLSDEYVESID